LVINDEVRRSLPGFEGQADWRESIRSRDVMKAVWLVATIYYTPMNRHLLLSSTAPKAHPE
jgi:hypothetical protein